MLTPEEVLDQLDLRPSMLAAEFGSGAGGFTIPLAKKLKSGRVYGLDVQEEKLSVLKNQANLENTSNIKAIVCDLDESGGSTLQSGLLDLVLIPNVLFQSEDKKAMIKEGARVLKKRGRLVVIDWKYSSPIGPEDGRISAKKVKGIAQDLKLSFEKELSVGEYHYGLVFNK